MNVLLVGSGAREHALAWKLAQSPRVSKLYAAPGNSGIATVASLVPWEGDLTSLATWAKEEGIDLTVVGPEAPLVEGLVDVFEAQGLRVFGPRQRAAMIEGSKAFAKQLMERYGIPTARFRTFREPLEALEFLEGQRFPLVVKDSGLAAGKGVMVAHSLAQAKQAIVNIFQGPESAEVVIEEYLEGEELSFLAITDGTNLLPLLPTQDHKRLLDGDRGPMTGGMGAVCPYPVAEEVPRRILNEILEPLLAALRAEGILYRGVIYAGLMLTAEGPKVLEFNARFGDPEAQVLLPLLRTDLVELFEATLKGRLSEIHLEWDPGAAACVVLAAPGYPEEPRRGIPLHLPPSWPEGVLAFYGGVKQTSEGLVSAGGRVLSVVGQGPTLSQAIERAYQAVRLVEFPHAQYRGDIGQRALRRLGLASRPISEGQSE
jgi:phosphoribosylamine--glycine ligase